MPKDFFKLETTMIEREVAEKDNVNLQVIPYVIMINQEENKIFIYQRGSGSAEDRLVSKYSIGLGGHIDISPDAWVNLPQVIAKEAIRELEQVLDVG
jgi:predicted NUDIX family phosphoesterase